MKNYKTIITHNGVFHADECFAIAFIALALNKYYKSFNIYRVNTVPTNIDEDTIVLDIGGGEFDHHGNYPEGRIYGDHFYKYATFGKVVRKFWASVFHDEKEYKRFDKVFVSHIDAYDNGDRSFFSDISVVINEMNDLWDIEPSYVYSYMVYHFPSYPNYEYKNVTENFLKAVEFCHSILLTKIAAISAAWRADEYVKLKVQQAENHTVIFDQYVPYLGKTGPEVYYVIFPSNREKAFNLSVMKDREGNFIKPLPHEWWGYNRGGNPPVKGLLFCHNSGFMAVFDTVENAKEAIAGILA